MGVKAVAWWRSNWAFGALVVCAVLALHASTALSGSLATAPQGALPPFVSLATSASGAVLPPFFHALGSTPAWAVDSFADVLSGKLAAAKYAGKVVLIGVTAPGVGPMLAAPGNPAMSSLQALASATSSILQSQLAHEPPWASWALWGSTALAAVFVLWGVPALSAWVGASVSLALVLGVLALEFGWLYAMGGWLPLMLVVAVLLLGTATQLVRRVVLARVPQPNSANEPAQTDRMMGLALQGQGQLDMDFARQQRFDKAQAVYAHVISFDRNLALPASPTAIKPEPVW